MSETSKNQPEDVEFVFSLWMVASYVISFSLILGMVFIGKSDGPILEIEKRDIFPVIYNLFWIFLPLHLRLFYSTEYWIPNAHKTLHYLIRIQAIVTVLSLVFPVAGLQIGVFISLISLLVCSGVTLWTVNKIPLKTGSWLTVSALLGYSMFIL